MKPSAPVSRSTSILLRNNNLPLSNINTPTNAAATPAPTTSATAFHVSHTPPSVIPADVVAMPPKMQAFAQHRIAYEYSSYLARAISQQNMYCTEEKTAGPSHLFSLRSDRSADITSPERQVETDSLDRRLTNLRHGWHPQKAPSLISEEERWANQPLPSEFFHVNNVALADEKSEPALLSRDAPFDYHEYGAAQQRLERLARLKMPDIPQSEPKQALLASAQFDNSIDVELQQRLARLKMPDIPQSEPEQALLASAQFDNSIDVGLQRRLDELRLKDQPKASYRKPKTTSDIQPNLSDIRISENNRKVVLPPTPAQIRIPQAFLQKIANTLRDQSRPMGYFYMKPEQKEDLDNKISRQNIELRKIETLSNDEQGLAKMNMLDFARNYLKASCFELTALTENEQEKLVYQAHGVLQKAINEKHLALQNLNSNYVDDTLFRDKAKEARTLLTNAPDFKVSQRVAAWHKAVDSKDHTTLINDCLNRIDIEFYEEMKALENHRKTATGKLTYKITNRAKYKQQIATLHHQLTELHLARRNIRGIAQAIELAIKSEKASSADITFHANPSAKIGAKIQIVPPSPADIDRRQQAIKAIQAQEEIKRGTFARAATGQAKESTSVPIQKKTLSRDEARLKEIDAELAYTRLQLKELQLTEEKESLIASKETETTIAQVKQPLPIEIEQVQRRATEHLKNVQREHDAAPEKKTLPKIAETLHNI